MNLRELETQLGRKFARLATNAVVSRPGLWRAFRGPIRKQFDRLAPRWDALRSEDAFAPLKQALVRLEVPEPDVGQNRIRATVLYVDRFGNTQLNLTREHLEQADVSPGIRVELELALERYYAVTARTFADARPGDIILYEDAYRNISIAINGGSAAEMFGIGPGQEVRIHLRTP
jgi:S-adenosylmethionine hydrolase